MIAASQPDELMIITALYDHDAQEVIQCAGGVRVGQERCRLTSVVPAVAGTTR